MIIYLFTPLYSLGVFGKIYESFFHVELAQQPETVNMKNVLRSIRVLLNANDVYFNLSIAKGGFYVICLTREATFYYKSKHGESCAFEIISRSSPKLWKKQVGLQSLS